MLVSRDTKVLQAAPAAYPYRSPLVQTGERAGGGAAKARRVLARRRVLKSGPRLPASFSPVTPRCRPRRCTVSSRAAANQADRADRGAGCGQPTAHGPWAPRPLIRQRVRLRAAWSQKKRWPDRNCLDNRAVVAHPNGVKGARRPHGCSGASPPAWGRVVRRRTRELATLQALAAKVWALVRDWWWVKSRAFRRQCLNCRSFGCKIQKGWRFPNGSSSVRP